MKSQGLWDALKCKKTATSANDLAAETDVSVVYVRRLLRKWAEAGFIESFDTGVKIGGNEARVLYFAKKDSPDKAPVVLSEAKGGQAYERIGARSHREEGSMNYDEFYKLYKSSGLTQPNFFRNVDWNSNQPTINRFIRRLRNGERVIMPDLAAKIREFYSVE